MWAWWTSKHVTPTTSLSHRVHIGYTSVEQYSEKWSPSYNNDGFVSLLVFVTRCECLLQTSRFIGLHRLVAINGLCNLLVVFVTHVCIIFNDIFVSV